MQSKYTPIKTPAINAKIRGNKTIKEIITFSTVVNVYTYYGNGKL